jgi:aspartyl-tRNA(Asn)/glutamyl-tRNA(Gln) amidotransferase subunit A
MSKSTPSVKEHLERAKAGEIALATFIRETLEKSDSIQKKYGPFITINRSARVPPRKGALFGLPISVKDNICTKGLQTTAGSKILEGYIPPFNATCIEKAEAAGGIILGKTTQDEFGFGTFNVNTRYSIPKNPFDTERSCGGSSGGAGCLTAVADFPQVAIAESTGGSITAPAAFTGTVGLTPTYGRISRYGLVDYSNSMDKIGVIGRCVYDTALLLSVISGHDPLDSTSSSQPVPDFTGSVGKEIAKIKIGMPKEYFSDGVDKRISKAVRGTADELVSLGASVEETSMPMTNYALPAYYLIAMSEASTNLAKYCGLRYGVQEDTDENFDEYFSKIRSEAFGEEAKRRILLGTYSRMAGFRDAYYLKALKVRTKIIEEFRAQFGRFDALLAPSMPILPPKFSEIAKLTPIQVYGIDMLTIAPNMAGMPTLSVPIGMIDKLPVGVQFISNQFNESTLIALGSAIEGLNGGHDRA